MAFKFCQGLRAQCNGYRFEGQKHVSPQAVTQPSLLVAVSASIVFSPPGASEESGLPHTSARTQLPQSMKIMHEIMYKLEVLYVLCVLLMGRQRNQVGLSPTSQAGSRTPMLPGRCGMPRTPRSCLSEWLSSPASIRFDFLFSEETSLIPELTVFPLYFAVGSISRQSIGALQNRQFSYVT